MQAFLSQKETKNLQSSEQNRLFSLTDKLGNMKRIIGYEPWNSDIAALLLRLILGGLFVRYGYMKFSSYDVIYPCFRMSLALVQNFPSTLSSLLNCFADFLY